MTPPSSAFSLGTGTSAFRVAAAATAIFVLAAAVVVGLLAFRSNRVFTDQVLSELRSEAALILAEARAGGLDALTERVKLRAGLDSGKLLLLADRSGKPLAGNIPRVPAGLETGPGGVFRLEGGRLAAGIRVETDGADLFVGRDIEDQREFLADVQRVFVVSFGALSLIGLLGGLAISRLVLRRIGAINQASQSIMSGDFARRVPVSARSDELDELARNLNLMLDRIELLMNGLRQVSDNIAHDLKTPLSRLRMRVEAALDDPRGALAHREALEYVLEASDELIKTFNALLLIARLEARALEASADRFDLGTLVRDVAELYGPLGEESGIPLTVSAETGLLIKANRQLVGQAVANLVDNAIKYSRASPGAGTPERPAVEVRVTRVSEGAEVSVADRGPGIRQADRERVLGRFVRLEESRTRPGTGLGLSLVAAVAGLYGGGIRLEDNAPGLRAVLVLPKRLLLDDTQP